MSIIANAIIRESVSYVEKLLLRISIEEKVPFTLPWFEVGISVVTMILIVAITVGIQSRLIQNMNIADELKQAEE